MMAERDDDLHTLTGAYVLDALEDRERDSFERHLTACGACTQEVADLQVATARLSEATELAPPPGLRERILLEANTTPQQRPIDAADVPEVGPSRGAVPWWASRLTAAAAALLVVAVAGLSYTVTNLNARLAEQETTAAQAQHATAQLAEVLAAPDAKLTTAETEDGATGRLVASPQRGEAVFVADGLPSPPSERTYQLWLINEDEAVSVGVFDPDTDGRATHVMTGDIANAAVIGVTIEPDGGSTQPTSEPIMAFEIG